MGERTLLGSVAEEHADNGSHVGFDIDYEDFVIIADEEGAGRCWRGEFPESEPAGLRSSC